MGERQVCRHCIRNKVTRPRGLCWTCYYTPGVKELHPSTSKFASRGNGNANTKRMPTEPTSALPATPEKLEVMRRRAERGESLFHPLDAMRPMNDTPGQHERNDEETDE